MRSWLRTVARNVSWLAVGDGAVKGGLLAVAILIGRGLSKEALGVYSVALAVVTVGIPLLALGQVEVLIRAVASAPSRARSLLRQARRLQRRLLVVGLPIGAAAAVAIDGDLGATLLAFLPYAWLRVETVTTGALFKGLDRMEVEVRARLAEMAVVITCVALLAATDSAVWVVGLGFGLGGAVGLAVIKSSVGDLTPATAGTPIGGLLSQGLPFVGLAISLQLLFRLDLLLLAVKGVSKTDLGIYASAASISWGLVFVPQLVAIAVFPTLSRWATGGRSLRRSTVRAAAGGLALGALMSAVVFALRKPVILIAFGSGFGGAIPVLGLLVWALPGASVSMLLGVVLAAWRRQCLNLLCLALTAVLFGSLCALWIPESGTLGAARAAVSAHCVGAVANLLAGLVLPERRSFELDPSTR